MEVLSVIFAALIAASLACAEPPLFKHLSKRQAGVVGAGVGSGTGGASGAAAAVSPVGLATSAVTAGSVSAGGGGSLEFSGLLGSGNAVFGAGIGGGLGSAAAAGSDATASVATSGSGMGGGAEIGAAGPLKVDIQPAGSRHGRFFYYNPYYSGYNGYYPHYVYGRK